MLIAIIAFLARAWILERLRGSIRHEYDAKLESLKTTLSSEASQNLALFTSEIDRQAEQLRISAMSFSEVQKAAIARKISAVDVLWVAVVDARKAFPSAISLTDVLTKDEMKSLYNGQMREELINLKFGIVTEFFGDVERYRPFLGEVVWTIFVTYYSLLGRIIYLFIQGRTDPNKLIWYEDETIKRIMQSSLGTEKFVEFTLLTENRLIWLNGEFTASILSSIDQLLSGRAFGADSLAHSQRTLEILATKPV